MEMSVSPSYNPHVKDLLRSFQSAAERSLNGPRQRHGRWPSSELSSGMSDYKSMEAKLKKAYSHESTISAPATPSFLPVPVFFPMDRTHCEKSDTYLEGHKIACFVVGGEQRLCLPQILNTVLRPRDFTLGQINSVCDDLHIHVCRCYPEQLESLKLAGILPATAHTCGLITKTDALRLCTALMQRPSATMDRVPGPDAFLVCHECFGKCKGIFHPELYTKEEAACVECSDCRGLFSPPQFVRHSHKSQENRTCHWGFDPANWRSYLLLAKDLEANVSLQKALDAVKARFDLKTQKRRETVAVADDSKRARYEVKSDPANTSEASSSAFRHWSSSELSALKEGKGAMVPPAFLQTGPPILLNPESVVPFKDNQRYDRGFAPNVSLAPQPKEERSKGDNEEAMDTHRPSSPTNDAASRPATATDKPPTMAPEHQQLVILFRQALSGELKDHEAAVGEFIGVQARQEEKLRELWRSKFHLCKEVEMLRRSQQQSNDESACKSLRLERSLEQADREHAVQLRQLHEDRSRLGRQLEQAMKELDEWKAKAATDAAATVKKEEQEPTAAPPPAENKDEEPPREKEPEEAEEADAMDTSDVEVKVEEVDDVDVEAVKIEEDAVTA